MRHAATTPEAPFFAGRGLLAALLALAVLCFAASAQAAPHTVHGIPNVYASETPVYVSDPDDILTQDDEDAITALAESLERDSGVEVVVVALKDIGEQDSREFATELFNLWGVGKKGRDNGLLILLVTEPPQRSVVFETGYGLEGDLPDALCYGIQQDYMVPYLQKNEYGAGLREGVRAVTRYLASGVVETPAPPPAASGPAAVGVLLICMVVASVLFVFGIFWCGYLLFRQTCPQCGKKRFIVRRSYTNVRNGQTLFYRYGKCISCGYEKEESNVPEEKRGTVFGRSGSGGRSRGSGGSSSRSSGRSSRGGGRSGGGGARSRF